VQGHIYRKKSSDGSWSRWYAVIDHPGVDGKRRQKTTTHETKRDAQAWLAPVVQELRAGQVYDTTVTVQEYLTSWLAGKQSLRPSTRLSYRCHIHQYLIPHLGHHRLTARPRPPRSTCTRTEPEAAGHRPRHPAQHDTGPLPATRPTTRLPCRDGLVQIRTVAFHRCQMNMLPRRWPGNCGASRPSRRRTAGR